MTIPAALPADHCAHLSALANSQTAPVRDVRRAVIICTYADTGSITAAADAAGVCRTTARTWIGRYQHSGLAGLSDLPRSGTPPKHGPDAVLALASHATAQPPPPYTVWTYLLLAQAMGADGYQVCPEWCRTTLAGLDLNPTRTVGWLNRPVDPAACAQFDERASAVCELLAAPPQPGVVRVCVDEKTAIAARSRTRPDLPCAPGTPVRREFEYVRHGVVNLQGAYNHDSGQVASAFCESNNTDAFITFVSGLLESWAPGEDTTMRLVLDNGASHVSRAAVAWLASQPRIEVCYTPKHASWLNPAELVFSVLHRQVLAGGSWQSKEHLRDAITCWYRERNKASPAPFAWAYRWSPGWSRTSR